MTMRTSPCESKRSSSSAPSAPTSPSGSRAAPADRRRTALPLLALCALLVPLAACEGCPGAEPGGANGAATGDGAAAEPKTSNGPAGAPGTREDALRLAREGQLDRAEAILLRLWQEGDLGVGPVLAAVRGQRGDVEGLESLLAEARHRDLSRADRLAIASGAVSTLPDPAAAAARLETRAATQIDPAQAALAAGLWDAAERPRRAVALWEVARDQWPDSADIHRQLVGLYAVTGRADALVQTLERVVALDPDDFTARINLVGRLAARGDREAALAAALPPEGTAPPAERERMAGDALLRAGLDEAAFAHFGRALEANPASCEARWGRARTLLSMDRTREGLEALWALVEAPVGGRPCRAREATRLILGRAPDAAAARARIERRLEAGKVADPEAVRAGLEAGALRPGR